MIIIVQYVNETKEMVSLISGLPWNPNENSPVDINFDILIN